MSSIFLPQTLHVESSVLHGRVVIPPSKSHSLRALLFASLATGTSRLTGIISSPDTDAMIIACRVLGANIEQYGDLYLVEGCSRTVPGGAQQVEDEALSIDVGNSGIVLRFATAVGAIGSKLMKVTGDTSICSNRPMGELLHALQQLGVSAMSLLGNGFAPLSIQGPIRSGVAHLNGSDSQPVSALLIAAAFSEQEVELIVENPGEKPWIDLTLEWLTKLERPVWQEEYRHYRIKGGGPPLGFDYEVPGDLSSAAFPVIAALVTHSSISVANVDMNDTQGDKKLFSVLERMGAQINFSEEKGELAVLPSQLRGIEVDINDFIDALPILAAVATFAEGETRIYNGAVARQKECNRISVMAEELKKMGALIEELEDGLVVQGSPLHGATFSSHGDHRVAMALAVAALGASGESCIEGIECVAKTYPEFVQDFQTIGAQMHLQEVVGE
jgi:3-phosphoshikimate 1-carboxyvinyltransferase